MEMGQFKAVKNGPSVHCNIFDYCAGKNLEEVRCWEVARSKCDFHYVFNVCSDCIVYLYERGSMDMSKKDIELILQKREPMSSH